MADGSYAVWAEERLSDFANSCLCCIRVWDHESMIDVRYDLYPLNEELDELLMFNLEAAELSPALLTRGFEACIFNGCEEGPEYGQSLAQLRQLRTLFGGTSDRLADVVFEAVAQPVHDSRTCSQRRKARSVFNPVGLRRGQRVKGTDIAKMVGEVLRPWAHYAEDPQWAQDGIARALALPSPDFCLIGAFLKKHGDLPYSEALRAEARRRQRLARYKALWRRWRLQWTCVSRWIKFVGERQGGVDGAIGAEAVDEYDAEMGDGASWAGQPPVNACAAAFLADMTEV